MNNTNTLFNTPAKNSGFPAAAVTPAASAAPEICQRNTASTAGATSSNAAARTQQPDTTFPSSSTPAGAVLETRRLDTDVLIIGGGTAGCYAAITLGRAANVRVLIVEKADIRRSGCLAAGVNALNAYITEGHTPQFYVDYAMRDADGIAREDLLLSMSERLNHVTEDMEQMGLVILKDADGKYVTRGARNLKINGENIKPILAAQVRKQKNVTVLEHVNVTGLRTERRSSKSEDRKEKTNESISVSEETTSKNKTFIENSDEYKSVGESAGRSKTCGETTDEYKGSAAAGRSTTCAETTDQYTSGSGTCGESSFPQNEEISVTGAFAFSVEDPVFYDIRAKAVLCATGGAAGLYRPNNPGFSRHKMWYPPFNTGAGYAMGLRAGAEMTTFEMRFIALRCKDTIAPTGTIAQGVGARQVNANGEIYESNYGLTTSQRVWGTTSETEAGRGPCYLHTQGITPQQEQDLYRAYLNMAPAQTLKWLESGQGPAAQDVEIAGSEPYIVGGHTASGFWVDEKRHTTLRGFYAAGDVAGGCPQKYVTGALAEGEIAAETILEDLGIKKEKPLPSNSISRDGNPAGQETPRRKSRTTCPTNAFLPIKYVQNVQTKDVQNTASAADTAHVQPAPDQSASIPKEELACTARAEIMYQGTDTATNHPGTPESAFSLENPPGLAEAVSTPEELQTHAARAELERFLRNPPSAFSTDDLEEAMQKVMDQYAGGISTGYRYNEAGLRIADQQIRQLEELSDTLSASDMDDLLRIYELRERLTVCRALIAHLAARRETRWHSFGENADYPEKSEEWQKFVNSRMVDGEIEILYREIR